jgi:hypothetical protein
LIFEIPLSNFKNINKMKKIITLLAVIGLIVFSSCEGPEGPPGQDGLIADVFELRNVNFSHDSNSPNTTGYFIGRELNPLLYDGDVILIYELSDNTSSGSPVWRQIPRTVYLSQGRNFDYDFDFSKEDFNIYAGGNYDLSSTPEWIKGLTFRIVIIPGPSNVTAKSASKKVDLSDYNAVIKAYNLDDSNVKVLN